MSSGDRALIKCLVDIFSKSPALRPGVEIAACGGLLNINTKYD